MLLAAVPALRASASSWRPCDGFHCRLHVHHRTRHSSALTLSLVRQSQLADVRIALRLHLCSDPVQQPVRNLTLASSDSLPREAHVTLQLPAHVASTSVKFLPIAVPLTRFVVGISVEVRECFIEVPRPLGRGVEPCDRSGVVERFGDAYTTEGTIEWLEETEPDSEATSPEAEVASDIRGDRMNGHEGAKVPYDLCTLLESCNVGEQPDGQALDTTLSDVTLIVGSGPDTNTFNLHRCILALASSVFRAMLTSDMLERRTGTVKLPNFTPSAVGVAVRHIYGARVDVTLHAFELYQFAHQYDITSLRRAAREAVLEAIGLRSCVYVLRFGVAFRDDELIDAASCFLAARFSEVIGDDFMVEEMCYVPKETFLRLMEDGTIKATEHEILLLALRWLSRNLGMGAEGVLRRIRWGLLTPEILDLADDIGLSALLPKNEALMNKPESKVEREEVRECCTARRRSLGKPNATLWVPVISKPPAALLPPPPRTKRRTKRRTRSRVRVEASKPIETTFDHGNLKWTFRAKLEECDTSSCCAPRLSASLWLEEDDDGRVWTEHGGEVLPVRVSANLMVWNCLGGQLRVVPIEVVFRSAGWANGWCVRDLLDGRKDGLFDYGEAVQVAIEIREILLV